MIHLRFPLTNRLLRSLTAPLAAALVLLAPRAQAQCELATATASAAASGDQFGYAVGFDGTRAVFGAPFQDTIGDLSGAAYVYEEVGGIWVPNGTLIASNSAAGDSFGEAVALSSDTLFVGAPLANGTGAVYVFERIAGIWTETGQLSSASLLGGERFGAALAFDGTTVAVGAPKGGTFNNTGAVYLYERSGGAGPFLEAGMLVPASTEVESRFGAAIALSGSTLAIGAPLSDVGTSEDAGRVHVFFDQPSGWTEVQQLDAGGDATEATHFGAAIALNDTWLIAGAPDMVDGDEIPGAAYSHLRNDMGTPAQPFDDQFATDAKLEPVGGNVSIRGFGFAAAFTNDRLLLGAPSGNQLTVPPGSVYSHRLVGGSWVFDERIQASGNEPGNRFGAALAAAGERFVAGSPLSNVAAPDGGSGSVVRINSSDLFRGCPETVSVGDGGKQVLSLDAGPGFAFQPYFVIGSASGTSPGIPLPGASIPLNLDFYLQFSLSNPNETPLIDTFSILDASGRATAQFNLGAGTAPLAFIGLQLNHAYAVLNPADLSINLVSNPVAIQLGS